MDGTAIRASRAAAGAQKKRPSGARLLAGRLWQQAARRKRREGMIFAVKLTAGQTHESTQATALGSVFKPMDRAIEDSGKEDEGEETEGEFVVAGWRCGGSA